MPANFETLCINTKDAAYALLEDWHHDADPEIDVVEEVLKRALASTMPSLEKIDGDWIMQMMWQVPDLMVDTEYSDEMDVGATTLKAVHFRIGSIIRKDVRERASELGLDSRGLRM